MASQSCLQTMLALENRPLKVQGSRESSRWRLRCSRGSCCRPPSGVRVSRVGCLRAAAGVGGFEGG